jgi:hypothetical protein
VLHWDTLGANRKAFLNLLVDNLPVEGSYLAGGTALALMLGHRESIDFDWFSPLDFDPEALASSLSRLGRLEITETTKGTLHGILDGVRITWLHYPNPLLADLVQPLDMPGLALASLLDIGLMKWAAVSHRGSRKDFIDLYMIASQAHTFEALMELLPEKFPQAQINHYHMVKSLSYFEDAEREPPLKMRCSIRWKEVKAFFIQEQKRLMDLLIGENTANDTGGQV